MALQEYTPSMSSNELAIKFRKQEIHLVCVAVNCLTLFNAFATGEGGISEVSASAFAKAVNRANETGTLYPRLSMTIIPLTVADGRDDFGNRQLMKKHILDCFKANEKYVKSPEMLFALEDRDDFDYQLAIDVLDEIVNEIPNFRYTENVFYTPYN